MIDVGQFDVNYRPEITIKGQVFADFIAKFTYADASEIARMTNNAKAAKVVGIGNGETPAVEQEDADQCTLYVDNASNENGSRAEMMLISPKGHKI